MTDEANDHFRLLSAYNRAANARLFDACATVAPTALTEPSAAPYSTILGLLEHLLASDEVWLARFEGEETAQLRDRAATRGLAEIRAARDALDDRIESYVAGLDAEALGRSFSYKNSRGGPLSAPISLLLTHMFNHQTHHRAQVQVLLRAAGLAGVSLDLHRLLGRPAQPGD